MEAAQLTTIIDNAIGKNVAIQTLKDEQQRQGEVQRQQSSAILGLKDEQRRQGDQLHRQGVILEDMQGQIQMIAEAFTPMLTSFEEMPKIKSTLKSHKQEISMTQQALKLHMKDPHAHDVIKKP